MITQKLIKELFDYCEDGNLIWKKNQRGHVKAGDIVGTIAKANGINYRQTKIKGKPIRLHRLIYLYHHGYLPDYIDHIDGDGLNNKIENLRSTNQSQNSQNSRLKNTNTSGYKNVYWNTQRKKWMVQLKLVEKQTYFGLYDDVELADLVAQEARNKFCGQFARHF